MEERAARGDETGAGAATVEDVTGDARGPAPGKLLNWLLRIIILEFKKHRRVQSDQIIFNLLFQFYCFILQSFYVQQVLL